MSMLKLDHRFCRLFTCKNAYNIPCLVTFEDKRKANYERGNMELEKRRQAMMEQQQREAERKAQKEKEEWERKQRELQEQEWKKQLELEKRLEKQRELERQREEERRKEIERREVIFKLSYFLRKMLHLISGYISLFLLCLFLCIIHSYLSCTNLNLPSPVEGKRVLACEGFSGPITGREGMSAGDSSIRAGLMAKLN